MYYNHYGGDVGFHYWVDPHYLDERDEDHYDWPADINTKAGTNTEVFNTISVGSQVEKVGSHDIDPDPNTINSVNEVDMVLSLSGAYQLRDGSIDGSHSYESDHFWGTRKVQLSAEVMTIDGTDDWQSINQNIDHNIVPERGFRSDNLLESEVEVDDPYEKHKDLATYTAKFAGKNALNAVVGEIPGGSTAFLVGDYSYGAYQTWTMDGGGVQTEDPDHKDYGSGLNDPSTATFYHEPEPMGNLIKGMQEDPDGNEPIDYQASVQLDWIFQDSIFEETDTATIRITAKNIVGVTGPNYDYETDGAESYVDITIRNGNIESVGSEHTDSDNVMLSTANGEKYWDDDITVGVNKRDDYDTLHEPSISSSTIPQVDVTVDWGYYDEDNNAVKDTVSNWKPYWPKITKSEITDCDREIYSVNHIDKELSFSHTYDLDGDDLDCDPGDTQEFTITITAESSSGYGDWEMSESYDISIEYLDNDDGGGGGGGGTGPPPPGGVSPMGNNTWLEGK